MRIAVCDVGLGNLRSVERALLKAAKPGIVQVDVTRDAEHIRLADKVVMPGQGGFGNCARALQGGLGEAVREHLDRGKAYLGICLGLQVLFETSEEAPGARGLGFLPGRVVKLGGGHTDPITGQPLKVPHVGWNTVEPRAANPGLLRPGPEEHYYFVHSFVVVPDDPAVVAATTHYGEPFVSAVAIENAFACQFHPEKSARAGIELLERFMAA